MYRLVNLLLLLYKLLLKFIKLDFIDLMLHFQGLKINKIFCKKIVYCSQFFFVIQTMSWPVFFSFLSLLFLFLFFYFYLLGNNYKATGMQ